MATFAAAVRRDRQALETALAAGARDGLPVAVALVPGALALGALVATSAVGSWTGWIGGVLVYGASAHAAVITLLSQGAPATAIILAVLVLGGRGVIYSAGLVSRMKNQPAWFRWAGPYLLVDPLFALVVEHTSNETPAQWTRYYYLGAGLAIWALWIPGIALGAAAGPLLPENAGLAFALPALQISFLVPGIRSMPAAVAAVVGGVAGATLAEMPGGIGLFVGTLAGAAAGLLAEGADR